MTNCNTIQYKNISNAVLTVSMPVEGETKATASSHSVVIVSVEQVTFTK